MKHTPTPWSIGNDKYKRPTYIKGTVNGNYQRICQTLSTPSTNTSEQRIANAAHIVKCVNAHDGLVAALKQAYSAMSRNKPNGSYPDELFYSDTFDLLYKTLESLKDD